MLAILLAAGVRGDGTPRAAPAQVPDVVYVGTPYDVVARMLKMARPNKDEVIYDLGCGDGRMVVMAAKRYGCRGIGYDIDPERVAAALRNVASNGVASLVRIVQADLFSADFSSADVLSLYLLPDINQKLLPKFRKLKPGARLVFHDYGLEGVVPDESVRVISNEDNAGHTIFLYTTPLKSAQR